MSRNRHQTVRLLAAALCVAFIAIVLLKGLWILALFGAVVLAMQMINLALGPRARSERRRREPPAAPRSPAPEPSASRATPPRASDAARRRARRGRGRT